MVRAKDRPASPTRPMKSAGAKNPEVRPTQARRSPSTAADAPDMDAVSPPSRSGGGMRPGSATLGAKPSPEQLYRMIQETAYFKAKARNFAPGHEVQDWIEAEAEVRRRLENRA